MKLSCVCIHCKVPPRPPSVFTETILSHLLTQDGLHKHIYGTVICSCNALGDSKQIVITES